MSDIYLQITETPAVVTLSAPVISAALSSTVTVANVVSVNVVTMPAINVTAAVSGGLSNAELRASAVSVAVTTMPAISISSVTVSNFPASQTVAGTVTIGSCVTHGVNVANSVTISSLPAISGTVTIGAGTAQIGSVTASISGIVPVSGTFYQATQPVSIASLPSLASGANQIGSVTASISNSVTISSIPAISGTVTASPQSILNGLNAYAAEYSNKIPVVAEVSPSVDFVYSSVNIADVDTEIFTYNGYFTKISATRWRSGFLTTSPVGSVFFYYNYNSGWELRLAYNNDFENYDPIYTSSNLASGFPPNSGWSLLSGWTENANLFVSNLQPQLYNGTVTVASCVTHGVNVANSVTVSSLPVSLSTTTIGGTARLNVTLSSATTIGATAPSYGNLYGGSDGTNLRAISVDTSGRTVVTGSVSVASTTVTVSALPSGALTTRFGSVVTANTAGITTAVTNTSRKYLLAQNISTGTVTIGIGFSPTTTQGIQLTSGAGLTFDSFVPTGAVYWLGATTGAAYTILEG